MIFYGGPLEGQEIQLPESMNIFYILEQNSWPPVNLTGIASQDKHYGKTLPDITYTTHIYRKNKAVVSINEDLSEVLSVMVHDKANFNVFIDTLEFIMILCGLSWRFVV